MEEEVSEIDLSKEIREFVNREKRIKISLKIETESCIGFLAVRMAVS